MSIASKLEHFINFFKINHEEANRSFTEKDNRKSFVFMLVALVFYILLQSSIHLNFALERSVPYEADDAYTYIVKAEQMEQGCFFQDCPALNSLKEQFQYNSENPQRERLRYRAETRAFLVYHPLHSLVMIPLKALLGSWERAYVAISILGIMLIASSICLLLRGLWGNAAAGIGLLILATSYFKGQGFHLLVPSNMSLGFLLLSCGLSLHYGRKAFRTVLICILCMLSLHVVGKVYALVAIYIYFISNPDVFKLNIKSLFPYVALLLPIVGIVALPYFISTPVLIPPASPLLTISSLEAIQQGIMRALRLMYFWDENEDFSLAFIVYGAAIASLFILKNKTKSVLLVSFPFIVLTILGIFYIVPGYPAELFYRLWCAAAVLLAGAFGAVLVWLYQNLSSRFTVKGQVGFINSAFILCSLILVSQIYSGIGHAHKVATLYEHRHDYNYVTSKVESVSKGCGTVFHTEETALFHYLSHGGLNCKTYYLAALERSNIDKIISKELPEPYYVFITQPTDKTLFVGGDKYIEVDASKFKKWHLLKAKIFVQSKTATVKFMSGDHESVLELERGEHEIALKDFILDTAASLKLMSVSKDQVFYLRGLIVNNDQKGNWPWGSDIKLFHQGYGKVTYDFDMDNYTQGLFKSLEIIDANGANMLAIGKL